MRNELKPCPFCGFQHPATIESGGRAYVECPLCGAGTSSRETEEDAMAAWNTRAERTCRYEWRTFGNPDDSQGCYKAWNCSNCGEINDNLEEPPIYCLICGAKVVE